MCRRVTRSSRYPMPSLLYGSRHATFGRPGLARRIVALAARIGIDALRRDRQEPLAIRRKLVRHDAVVERCHRPRLAAIERQHVDLQRPAAIGHEGEPRAVAEEARRGVARVARQLHDRIAVQRRAPQRRHVAVVRAARLAHDEHRVLAVWRHAHFLDRAIPIEVVRRERLPLFHGNAMRTSGAPERGCNARSIRATLASNAPMAIAVCTNFRARGKGDAHDLPAVLRHRGTSASYKTFGRGAVNAAHAGDA